MPMHTTEEHDRYWAEMLDEVEVEAAVIPGARPPKDEHYACLGCNHVFFGDDAKPLPGVGWVCPECDEVLITPLTDEIREEVIRRREARIFKTGERTQAQIDDEAFELMERLGLEAPADAEGFTIVVADWDSE